MRRFRTDVLVLLIFLALGVWVAAELWIDLDHRTHAHNPTDHVWFEWLLAHAAHSVTTLSNPFFSMQQNVPDGVNMMANTSVLALAIPLTPITLAFGPATSYATLLSSGLALTAFTAYKMLNLYVTRPAAMTAGALFGFAPGVVHHANGQPNFTTHFLLPLLLHRTLLIMNLGGRFDGVSRAKPTDRLRHGVVLGLLVTAQAFINEEMLLITALACGVLTLLLRPPLVPFLQSLGVCAAVASVLLAYPLWLQMSGPQSFSALPATNHNWGEDLAAYVTYSRDTLAGSSTVESTLGLTEQNSWFGWPLLLLSLAAVLVLRSRPAVVAAVCAVLFGVLSLGSQIRLSTVVTTIPGPFSLLDSLPLFKLMIPSRFNFVVCGAIAILIALLIDRFGLHSGWGVATVLALLPLFPTPLPTQTHRPVPTFITSGAWRAHVPPGYTLVPVPLPANVPDAGLDSLRWSAVSLNEFAIPRGYFLGPDATRIGMYGAPPTPTSALLDRVTHTGIVPNVSATERQSALDDLTRWRAACVVLDPSHPRAAALRSALTALLGPPASPDVWDLLGSSDGH